MTSDNDQYCKPAPGIRSDDKTLTPFSWSAQCFQSAFLCHSGVPGSIFAEPPAALEIDTPTGGIELLSGGDRWGVYPTGIAPGTAEGDPG